MRSSFSRDFSRFRQPAGNTDKHRLNRDITALEVRVIGLDGTALGVMRTREALALAEEAGVDLVEVAPEAKPPVCKILDYGKLKYREQKKEAATRKKSSVQAVKEIRLRYNTDDHDLETKIRNARRFIGEGDRVRFEMRFKGREIVYQDLGREMYQRVIKDLADVAAVDEMPPMQGPKMILILAPKGQQKAK